MSISDNIVSLLERIHAAARRAGRSPDEISVMAVTKTVEPARIRQVYDAGIRTFGENRVQEFATKVDTLGDLQGVEWHMVGHLQSNKAAKAVELFDAVDSVDSVRLAQRLNAAALQLGKRLPVLIEINIGGEAAKSGVALEHPELENLLVTAHQLTAIEIRGLMTVPPYNGDPERSRPYFRKMRELFHQIAERKLPGIPMEVLSMGMSHDFEVAIEEGATCVRLGTAIFGERPKRG